jgi:hypothetical protein
MIRFISSIVSSLCVFIFSLIRGCVVGLVERIGSTQSGVQREFAGTPTYCSLNLNRGGEPTAKDDIEALVKFRFCF